MVRAQEQSTGRTIRTGWEEAEDSLTAVPAPAPPGLRHDEHRPPHRSRRLAAVLTALALLAVVTPWVLLRGEEPADVARTYLDALVAGDLQVVRDHLAPLEGADSAALTASVRAATPGRITGYTVDEVVVRGVVATVRATLRTPSEEHSCELTLTAVPDGPLHALRWQLQPVPLPVLTLEPRASTGEVLLNGEPVAIPPVRWSGRRTDRPSVTLHVLPGRYTVQLPPTEASLEPRIVEFSVPPVLEHWHTGVLSVDYRPDRSGRLTAQAVILTALFRCLRTGLARPPGCPIGVRLPADTPGRWQLLELPEISFASMAGETFDYRGQGLSARFIPAASRSGEAELPGPGQRPHRMRIDFGVTLRQEGPDLEVQHWIYATSRPGGD